MLKRYEPVREEAKERQREHGNTAPGRTKITQEVKTQPELFIPEKKEGTLSQLIDEVKEPNERRTDAIRAKAAEKEQ